MTTNEKREPPPSVGVDIAVEFGRKWRMEDGGNNDVPLDWLANRITEAVNAARFDGGWRSMDSAPRDGSVFMVWAEPGQHDLPAMFSLCSWDEDAGFCIDELRQPTLWKPLPPLDAPRASP